MAGAGESGLVHRFVEAEGSRWHYVQAGAGPPVVMLHGWPETWYGWRHQIPAVSATHTVYAPDLLGWGESDKPEGDYSVRAMVGRLKGFLDALGIERADFIGHDWGGIISYPFAIQYPEVVNRLFILNTAFHRRPPMAPLHRYYFHLPLLPELHFRLFGDSLIRWIIRWWAWNQAAFPPEVIAVYQEAFRRPGAHACTLRYYRASSVSLMWGRRRYDGPRLAAPLLAVWGERDPVLPLRAAEYLKEDLPGTRVVRISAAGHFPHEEQPEQVTRLLLAFLQGDAGFAGAEGSC